MYFVLFLYISLQSETTIKLNNMKATDLKEVVIPQVGVRYSAKVDNVKVYGSDSIGWKVWVESKKENGNKTFVCVNPKNAKGEMLVYKTSDLAISKANRFLNNKN